MQAVRAAGEAEGVRGARAALRIRVVERPVLAAGRNPLHVDVPRHLSRLREVGRHRCAPLPAVVRRAHFDRGRVRGAPVRTAVDREHRPGRDRRAPHDRRRHDLVAVRPQDLFRRAPSDAVLALGQQDHVRLAHHLPVVDPQPPLGRIEQHVGIGEVSRPGEEDGIGEARRHLPESAIGAPEKRRVLEVWIATRVGSDGEPERVRSDRRGGRDVGMDHLARSVVGLQCQELQRIEYRRVGGRACGWRALGHRRGRSHGGDAVGSGFQDLWYLRRAKDPVGHGGAVRAGDRGQ